MKRCRPIDPEWMPRSCEEAQLAALNQVLDAVWTDNRFYARKWRSAGVPAAPLESLADLATIPFTTRAELIADQSAAPPLGTNLTGQPSALIRFHRSSGTTREPILWADSAESWQWMMRGSESLWRLAGVRPSDRALFLMPFGASSGPWIIYEGACRLGCGCFPLGLAEPQEQLRWLANFKPTVLAAKPSVLQALAEAVLAGGRDPAELGVKKLILCGAHETSQRTALEQSWAAACFNRYGLTEAGSVAGECAAHTGGLHLLDDAYIAECVHPETRLPMPDGDRGELVLTTLGRLTRPILRYRTGDLVRLVRDPICSCGRRGSMLLGGVTRQAHRQGQGKFIAPGRSFHGNAIG